MRVQKLRVEAAEERAKHFNTIRPVIPTKQEWRVKENTSTPVIIASDNDMDLLDDDEPVLIKDGSLPLTGMNINMVFTLSAEFRGVEDWSLRCALVPRRLSSRSSRSSASTGSHCAFEATSMGHRSPRCSSTTTLSSA
jgi:hypothetical protein